MAYVKNNPNLVGKYVKLIGRKSSALGYFESGTVVKITEMDECRGYSFEDNEGNKVIEAGFSGFEIL